LPDRRVKAARPTPRDVNGGTIMRMLALRLARWTRRSSFGRWAKGTSGTHGSALALEPGERWLAAVLMVGVVTLFAFFVIVLKKDVRHAELLRAQAYERAVAEGDCDRQHSPDDRAACLAQVDGESPATVAAAHAVPENDVAGDGGRLATASMRSVDTQ
jgi:hypothetical protein